MEAGPLLVLYFLPTIIAFVRGRSVWPIFLLNVLLGWTILGWFPVFVMAFACDRLTITIRHK